MWITHQPSDHMEELSMFSNNSRSSYVDNGRDETVGEIKALQAEVKKKHITATVVSPGQETIPWKIQPKLRSRRLPRQLGSLSARLIETIVPSCYGSTTASHPSYL